MVPMFDFKILQIISALLGIIIVGIIAYFKWSFTYWKKKNFPCIEASIPLGHIENPFTNKFYVGELVQKGYTAAKAYGHKYGGMYLITIPKCFIIDPVIVKSILQQDFDHFTDRGFYYNEKDDPLSANLFALGGEKWRYIRTKLSPVFTAGKLKMMFEALVKCGYQLRDAIDIIYENKHEIDIKDISVCYSIDVIGCCAFGLECNSFKNPNSEFKEEGKKIFNFDSSFRRAKIAFVFAFPNVARWLRLKLFDEKSIEFFITVVKDTINFRQRNNIARKDMMQLLIDLKRDENSIFDDNTIKELAAQVFIFFAAGFETSSSTLSFCLYELSVNQNIQTKLRDEVNTILSKHEGKVTYGSIMDMKYMNQVVDETLRKYPPVSFITRQCVKDYRIPGTDAVIETGIDVIISILGQHRDKEYYTEPEKFDPERFSEKNKANRLPFTYLPFGEGPRMCIGLRFGLMQIKVALTVLLNQYRFELNSKTVEPITFEPYSFTLIPKNGIFLNMEKVS